MMIISFRHYPASGPSDDSHSHLSFIRDSHILTTTMSSSSSISHTKVNKPLVAVVVVASSIILGIFICISFHLRSRQRENSAHRGAPDRHCNVRNKSSDMELGYKNSQNSRCGWMPRLKYSRSRNLKPEPFPLTPPVRSPILGTPPSSPIIIVERYPSKTALDEPTSADPLRSSISPVSPPAYIPSVSSPTRRALPSPPTSPIKSPRSPPISKKKLEIKTGTCECPPEVVQSPPPAYKRSRIIERPISRSVSANVLRTPRRTLTRRPSAATSLTSIPSPSSPSSPTASSSTRVLSMALQSDTRRLPRLMTVCQTFLPTFPDEVSVRAKDAVLLLEEYGDNWCLVQLLATSTARRGVVPRSCLQEYVDEDDEPSS